MFWIILLGHQEEVRMEEAMIAVSGRAALNRINDIIFIRLRKKKISVLSIDDPESFGENISETVPDLMIISPDAFPAIHEEFSRVIVAESEDRRLAEALAGFMGETKQKDLRCPVIPYHHTRCALLVPAAADSRIHELIFSIASGLAERQIPFRMCIGFHACAGGDLILSLESCEAILNREPFVNRDVLFLDDYRSIPEGIRNRTVREACRYIETHFPNKIRLGTIAEHVHISSNYLDHLFTRETGMSMSSYLETVRLRNARKLILSTDGLLKEIARSCGFKNQSYFSKCFRQRYGCSPSEMRTRLRWV